MLFAPPGKKWRGITVVVEVAALVTKIVGAPLFPGFLSLGAPPPWLRDVAGGEELGFTSPL